MSTILPWLLDNMADISKNFVEIEDAMQVKVNEEIAIQTSFENLYIFEKAKASNKTLESTKYRDQVASFREEISKLNKQLVAEIDGALMKRVVLTREIRAKYEEKLANEKTAFTTAHSRLTKETRVATSTCDEKNVELEILTADLSASFVASEEKVAAEICKCKRCSRSFTRFKPARCNHPH